MKAHDWSSNIKNLKFHYLYPTLTLWQTLFLANLISDDISKSQIFCFIWLNLTVLYWALLCCGLSHEIYKILDHSLFYEIFRGLWILLNCNFETLSFILLDWCSTSLLYLLYSSSFFLDRFLIFSSVCDIFDRSPSLSFCKCCVHLADYLYNASWERE